MIVVTEKSLINVSQIMHADLDISLNVLKGMTVYFTDGSQRTLNDREAGAVFGALQSAGNAPIIQQAAGPLPRV
jgi:hypothetical protein